jgi:hypothetical protein
MSVFSVILDLKQFRSTPFCMVHAKHLALTVCPYLCWHHQPEWLSRYSDWLRDGQPSGQSSSPGRGNIFLISTESRPALGPIQPHVQWVTESISPGVKRPGREADQSPPSSAEIKNAEATTPLLLMFSRHSV